MNASTSSRTHFVSDLYPSCSAPFSISPIKIIAYMTILCMFRKRIYDSNFTQQIKYCGFFSLFY